MQHYTPHPSSLFEGYYSKFRLPTGAHLALIICSVPRATSLPPHMLSLTYVPRTQSPKNPVWQREFWVPDIQRVVLDSRTSAFELRVPGYGVMRCNAEGGTEWDIEAEGVRFRAKTTGTRVAWGKEVGGGTPEGWLVKLPLPLHWHVHSLEAACEFELDIPSLGESFPIEDRNGKGVVHQEKNWANSFPESHVWVQATTDGGSGVCMAGGRILGMTAFLLGYRSKDLNVDFAPPFALGVQLPLISRFLSPFMAVDVDYQNRTFKLAVQSLWRKIELKAKAPRGTFFGLGAPFSEGHRKNFCGESFEAKVEIVVFERSWWPWSAWVEVKREMFEGASLEFGGKYYGDRGEKRD
ncbi:hypothetical protein GQ43DRAFT_133406 [Delitschia confertaspora ATCC 74209]|uniref:Tocopherol cyclase n=1 Tax=Delitschia confertaspora ATCC 74209 TaxID=1513339 RepID=A0A9P4JGN0_9PLEO|nr:hypothetical protein GQ43DRAFT_133406 [Delitschia confertaspora ATCC 74209]